MNKILSLGVGIQTAALYFMSSIGEYERCDYAIFADTGGEKSETLEYYEYMINWQRVNKGIDLYKADYKNLERDLLRHTNSTNNRFASIPVFTLTNGQIGMLRRQCTGEYKISQVNRKYREILNLPGRSRFPITEVWMGITYDEMHRMSIPREKWKVNVYPFCGYKVYPDGTTQRIDVQIKSRNDCINWLSEHGFMIPEKSSCVFCPFQNDDNWIRLKERQPDDFERACRVDETIRNSTKHGIKSPIYVHEQMKPLREVVFNQAQRTLWGNCSDNCGV